MLNPISEAPTHFLELPESIVNILNVQMPFEDADVIADEYGKDTALYQYTIEGNWYRHGLESLALALFCAGVSEEIIKDSIITALDAYANNC